jgi:predicted GIY-YIG superfamily endonuclease
MPMSLTGYVYLIECKDQKSVKIGFGAKPIDRLRQLQTGNMSKLTMVNQAKCYSEVERVVQNALSEYRIAREWYSCVDLAKEIFCWLEDEYEDQAFLQQWCGGGEPILTVEDAKIMIAVALKHWELAKDQFVDEGV